MSRFLGLIFLGFVVQNCSSAAVTSVTLYGTGGGSKFGHLYDHLNATSTYYGGTGTNMLADGSYSSDIRSDGSAGTDPNPMTPPAGRYSVGIQTQASMSTLIFEAKSQLLQQNDPSDYNQVFGELTFTFASSNDLNVNDFGQTQPGSFLWTTRNGVNLTTPITVSKGSNYFGLSGLQVFSFSITSSTAGSFGPSSPGISSTFIFTPATTPTVPEPASFAIFGALGVGAMVARRRRSSK
jgi:hypothetical protein